MVSPPDDESTREELDETDVFEETEHTEQNEPDGTTEPKKSDDGGEIQDSEDSSKDVDQTTGFPSGDDEPTTAVNSSSQSDSDEPGADEQYCSSCGTVIKQQAEICPECGVRQGKADSDQPKKNPGIAAIASFFFAGLGQIYNGEFVKGILLMILQIVNVMLMIVLVGFLTFPIVWLYSMYDAYKTAEKINEGQKSV